MKYRPEIDGLRAIAVVLVLLFHLVVTRFAPGGFIGVDVFFVISGYLITRHLQNDLVKGFAGIADFYHRRVRRIFPALFATYAFCIVIELCLRFPSTIDSFSTSLLSSVLFSSNIYFFRTVSYFAWEAKGNSLLHTWSLSLEEQFYIVLPLLLIGVARNSKWTQFVALVATLLVSLGASEYFVRTNPVASFFLLPQRAWELLAGSVLSLGFLPRIENRVLAETLGLSGIAAIVGSALLLNESSPFPGFLAVVPVGGTMLILASTGARRTLVAGALSVAPMRFLGKISYSLYLWHWPLIVYSRYWHPAETRGEKAAFIILSIGVAWLSWRFIEQPFRGISRRGWTLGVSGLAMVTAAIIAVSLPSISSSLWPKNDEAEADLAFLKQYDLAKALRSEICFLAKSKWTLDESDCLNVVSDKPNVLIFGDSHAAQLWHGLSHHYRAVNFLQATGGNCTAVNGFNSSNCATLNDQIINGFLPTHHLDAIILAGRWSARDIVALGRLFERLRPYAGKIVLVGPLPEYNLPFSEVAARAIYAKRPELASRYLSSQIPVLDDAMRSSFANSGVLYISAYQAMCDPDCVQRDSQGNLVMQDNDHLTEAGSLVFAQRLPPALFNDGARK